jgi:SAM-dependent methyltransferase
MPIPPTDLVFRVTSGHDLHWFDVSGKMTLDDFADGLQSIGRSFADFRDIYDFGCGCGRLLRWLVPETTHARVSGSDIDAPAIAWLRDAIPQVDARVNDGLPPLPFGDNSFDLVVGYSVFSHLDVDYQDRWLAELQRVTKPGAILLLTVHGSYNWDYTKRTVFAKLPQLDQLDEQYREQGLLYWREDGWDQHFPDYYHTAWHTDSYIREHWATWFEVLDVRSGKARPTQDMVVLRRR